MKKNTLQTQEAAVTESLILFSDLSALAPKDKVLYYTGYCQRLGLDPFTKPFDILRLNNREVLYLTRSGAQQLNKLHGVSHDITGRRVIEGADIYEVTCKASLPDGRHTESIGAASVANLKGEAYCNAMMKAETKAKRRSTLDLIGLGILSEEETESIPDAQKVNFSLDSDDFDPDAQLEHGAAVLKAIAAARSIGDLNRIYRANQALVEQNEMRPAFTHRKSELA